MSSGPIHVFEKSLAESHKAEELPIWREIYEKAFPDMIAMISYRENGEHQRAGIDRGVYLENSRQILIDEKAHWTTFTTVALEYVSNASANPPTPGWICKSLRAEYIAYAFIPFGKCYLFPVLQLQQAWNKNKETWMQKFPCREAKNGDTHGNIKYVTKFVGVPPDTIMAAIGQCLRVTFTPMEMQGATK